MVSNFKCEKCNEELVLDDYFTYLELKVPKAKVLGNFSYIYMKRIQTS